MKSDVLRVLYGERIDVDTDHVFRISAQYTATNSRSHLYDSWPETPCAPKQNARREIPLVKAGSRANRLQVLKIFLESGRRRIHADQSFVFIGHQLCITVGVRERTRS